MALVLGRGLIFGCRWMQFMLATELSVGKDSGKLHGTVHGLFKPCKFPCKCTKNNKLPEPDTANSTVSLKPCYYPCPYPAQHSFGGEVRASRKVNLCSATCQCRPRIKRHAEQVCDSHSSRRRRFGQRTSASHQLLQTASFCVKHQGQPWNSGYI